MNLVLYVFGIMQMLLRIIMGPGMVAHSFKHASTKEAGDGGGVSRDGDGPKASLIYSEF